MSSAPSGELTITPQDYEITAIAERNRFAPVMNIEFALQRRETVKRAFSDLMEDGQDFGKIPGTGSKPTLMQPGAQKLDNLFGLVPRFPMELMRIEEDWTGERHGGEPFFRYMVVCQLMRGDFVMGEAIGECNSFESKYRWRKTDRVCPACSQPTIIFTKRNNWWCNQHKGGCGKGFKIDDESITKQKVGRQPNPEIFDQINTLLKMAQKRAHVGATINATSASEFFTQDLEDRPAETESSGSSGDQRHPAEPGREEPPRPQGASDGSTGRSSASGTSKTPDRPIPEELTLLIKRIRENATGAIADGFKMIELAMVEQYSRFGEGKRGIEDYNQAVLNFRKKYPRGATPLEAYVDCVLDLWEMVETARDTADARDAVATGGDPKEATGEFVADDSDLPEGFGEKGEK